MAVKNLDYNTCEVSLLIFNSHVLFERALTNYRIQVQVALKTCWSFYGRNQNKLQPKVHLPNVFV